MSAPIRGELVLPNGDVVSTRDRRGGHDLEVRDPSAATRSLEWRRPGLPIVQDWDASQAFRAGYIANVIAYRCVQLRANAASSVPLLAGRRGRVNESSPLTALFSPPELGGRGIAPKLSARKLLRWTFGQEIVTGRRAWEIETADGRKDGRPVAFWPLAASSLREIPSERGSEWFRLFEYGPKMQAVKLPPELVFYGWDPSGTDFRKAESAIGAARYDLSLITLCDRYGMAFLQNHAVPAAVVTTTRFPDEESRQGFRRRWEHEFEGADNVGRVHFHEVDDEGDGPVGDTIDVKVLGLSARDARLIETRKEAMLEVAIALGTPWSKLDASGRTYDNADAEDRDWWENTVLPDMVDLADDINMQLAPRFGDEVVWFDLSGVRALARKVHPVTQEVGAPALLQARIMQINEARADYGLGPVEGGDRFLTDDEVMLFAGQTADEAVRSALVELEVRMASLTPPAPEPAPELAPEPEPAPEPTAVAVEDRAPDPEAVEARRALIWRSADAVVTSIEARWVRAMRRLFARQLDATIARLTGKRGRQALGYTTDGTPDGTRDSADPVDAAAVFDQAFWVAATLEVVEDLYEQAMVAGLERVALSFAVTFDLEAPWVDEMLQARANQLAGQVTQTTYDAIVAELVEGVANGESIDDLATRVRNVFQIADETRSVRIARTEVISAYNGAAVRGVETLPRDVVLAQEWIATRDGRTRDSHASADGQVQLIGEPFVVAGRAARHPGDPALPAAETVNCRCTVAFLTPEDYAELDRAPRRVEVRSAHALLGLVPFGDDFDEIRFRRVLEGVAA